MNTIKNFWNDETGLELSEYAVATALVTAAMALAWRTLGDAVVARIKALTTEVNASNGTRPV